MAAHGDTRDLEADEPDTGPLRLCAVTRVQKPPEDLLRFVVDPAGTIVPDLSRRLPGRGIWVDGRRPTLEQAVKRGIFAKSLKRSVTVPPDLVERVEQLLIRRTCEALSLANKAGLVTAGFTKVDEQIAAGAAALLLHASDGADDGSAKLDRHLKAVHGPEAATPRICKDLTSAEMSLALGRLNVVHAAASEGGASRRLLEAAGRLRRFRMTGD